MCKPYVLLSVLLWVGMSGHGLAKFTMGGSNLLFHVYYIWVWVDQINYGCAWVCQIIYGWEWVVQVYYGWVF